MSSVLERFELVTFRIFKSILFHDGKNTIYISPSMGIWTRSYGILQNAGLIYVIHVVKEDIGDGFFWEYSASLKTRWLRYAYSEFEINDIITKIIKSYRKKKLRKILKEEYL